MATTAEKQRAKEILLRLQKSGEAMTADENRFVNRVLNEVADRVKSLHVDSRGQAKEFGVPESILENWGTVQTAAAEEGFVVGGHRITGKGLNDKLRDALTNRKTVIEAGSLLVPVERDDPAVEPQKPRMLLDLIPSKQVGGNDVSFLRQSARDNNAAIVPDGTVKPTSIYTLAEESGKLATFAHLSEYVPNRLFEDSAMLRSWLESEMAYGLDLAIEADAVATILADDDIQSQAADVRGPIASIRRALTKLQSRAVQPNVLALSLYDAEALDLEQDNEGRFYFAGPQQSGASPVWSVPVVVNDAVPLGTALLMDATQALRRFVRDAARLDVDAFSRFDRNESRLRLEARSLTVVKLPFAICAVDLLAGS